MPAAEQDASQAARREQITTARAANVILAIIKHTTNRAMINIIHKDHKIVKFLTSVWSDFYYGRPTDRKFYLSFII